MLFQLQIQASAIIKLLFSFYFIFKKFNFDGFLLAIRSSFVCSTKWVAGWLIYLFSYKKREIDPLKTNKFNILLYIKVSQRGVLFNRKSARSQFLSFNFCLSSKYGILSAYSFLKLTLHFLKYRLLVLSKLHCLS